MKRYLIKVTIHEFELLFGKENKKIQYFGKPAKVENIIKYGYKTARGAQYNLNWHNEYNASFGNPHKVELIEVEV